MIRFGISLMLVCLVSSTILVFTYKITHPLIVLQKEREEKERLSSAFPEGETFKKIDNYYEIYKNNILLGYVLKVEAQGYTGPIKMLVGFDSQGVIKGIEILEQRETPGLGGKVTEIRYGEKEPWFLRQFRGKIAKELDLKKIVTITGATISSRAVIEGVKKSIEEFLNNR